MPVAMPGGSSFNFSYTKEGEDEPEPPSAMNFSQPPQPPPFRAMPMGYPPPSAMPMPMPMPMMTPYGYMQQPMPVLGHPGMPLSTMPMMAQQLPSVQGYPVASRGNTNMGAAPRGDSAAVISEEEFPPLGATPAKKKGIATPAPEATSAPEKTPAKPKVASQSFLVPSVVKAGKK